MEALGIPPHIALQLLAWYSWSCSVAATGWDYSQRIAAAVLSVFEPRAYYFAKDHDNYPSPFPAATVNPTASCATPIEWVYDADAKTFWRYGLYRATRGVGCEEMRHPLPVLSLEAAGENSVLVDFTDFIEGVRVVGDAEDIRWPTLSHIVAAWTLSSGIVLDLEKVKEFKLITVDGDELLFSPDEYPGGEITRAESESESESEAAPEDLSGNAADMARVD